MKNRVCLLLISVLLISCTGGNKQAHSEKEIFIPDTLKNTFRDVELPIEQRIKDLINRLTLEEKVSLMNSNASAVPRLGIPFYNWWNEALHGVAGSGIATIFPQSIGLAATFDTALVHQVSSAISDEARAKFNAVRKIDPDKLNIGLTFWSPNINIFRDPRWGRGQETYGEDPFLTSAIGAAFVKGLQGEKPGKLKAAACAKHYAVHSGPEGNRHSFNAMVNEKDLYETYLPAFEHLVRKNVAGVMCAYNRTNDKPCCGSNLLLSEILREKWGFDGYMVSDCGAITDIHSGHHYIDNVLESIALSLKNGVNLSCGGEYVNLIEAVGKGYVSQSLIDSSLSQLLQIQFQLGIYDPQGANEYDAISEEVINCNNHRSIAKEAAAKSLVLLKNDTILPLSPKTKKIMVLGPHANNNDVLMGSYSAISNNMTTILEGIVSRVDKGTKVDYFYGFLSADDVYHEWFLNWAHTYDAIIVVAGLSNLLEGEEGTAFLSESKGDKDGIRLPSIQEKYLRLLRESGNKPIVLVLTGGSAVALDKIEPNVNAILQVWYPGEEGGNAVADAIFGNINPSGRLPVTFYKSTYDIPDFDNYSMENRTYKYCKEEPCYPFGFGLSYSKYEYSDINVSKKDNDVEISADVKNIGKISGEEVVQLYLSSPQAEYRVPLFDLKGFKRVFLKPGEAKKLVFKLSVADLKNFNMKGEQVLIPGTYTIYIGGALPTKRSLDLGGSKYVTKKSVF